MFCCSLCEGAAKGAMDGPVRRYGDVIGLGNFSARMTVIASGEERRVRRASPGECAAASTLEEIVDTGSTCIHARSVYLMWNAVWPYLGVTSKEVATLNLDEYCRLSVGLWAPKLAIPVFAVLMDLVPLVLKTSGYQIFASKRLRKLVTFFFIAGFA